MITNECNDDIQLDEIIVMPQSPNILFAYWSISNNKQYMVEHHLRTQWERLPKLIRINNITAINFNGHNAHQHLDFLVFEDTNQWFFNDLHPNCTYCVEVGTKTQDGSFFSVLRSKPVDTPRQSPNEIGIHEKSVNNWKGGKATEPEWLEHFSSYSYYQKNNSKHL